jgi:subtilisin family serine protease
MNTSSGSHASIALLLGLIAVPMVVGAEEAPAAEGRYLVKFRAFGDAEIATRSAGGHLKRTLPRQKLATVSLSPKALQILMKNPSVESVEVDQRRYPLAQNKPYGIGMVQADHADLTTSSASNGVTVCVVDSGYYHAHEDLQDSNVSGTNDPGTGNWYEDSCGHGTHVTGTVAALDNAVGVVGVNRNGLLQVHVEKVFNGSSCGWAYSSDLIAALDRCQDAVAGTSQKLVVNMSLGGSASSANEQAAFQGAYDSGALLVAAAGNGSSTAVSYPAGYASVISAAAVDSTGTAAGFSQRNADVELAAPGVAVVSTTPFNTPRLNAGDNSWFGTGLIGAAAMDAAGVLVDGGICDASGAWNDNIVLCQRGNISFAQKVANVAAGGGLGAVIYNNVSGGFTGTLNGTSATPAIAISKEDGEAALIQVGLDSTLVNSAGAGNGYEPYNGTSMATPHVSGVAALLWSFYPSKTNADIREALQRTALDKGTAGRDNTYGFGIVRAKVAFDYLAGILPPPPPPPPPPPGTISLTVSKVNSGGQRYARLSWNGATGSSVNYYRNSKKFKTANDGTHRDGPLALGTYTYKVCKLNTTTCSSSLTVTY